MGKPHRPRPVLINFPTFPIDTILKAARLLNTALEISEKDTSESAGLVAWAEKRYADKERNIQKLCRRKQLIIKAVRQISNASSNGQRIVATSEIECAMVAWDEGVPSGTRSHLSKLVEDGYLCRVAEGYFWPADVAFDKEDTP